MRETCKKIYLEDLKGNNKRDNAARQLMMEHGLDYALDIYSDPDFVEVTGKKGGDTLTFRLYNDGTTVER